MIRNPIFYVFVNRFERLEGGGGAFSQQTSFISVKNARMQKSRRVHRQVERTVHRQTAHTRDAHLTCRYAANRQSILLPQERSHVVNEICGTRSVCQTNTLSERV
jgi:hypothetical protein